MSRLSFGMFALAGAGIPQTYFLYHQSQSSQDLDGAYGVTVDTNDNIYLSGKTKYDTYNKAHLTKFTKDATVTWQRTNYEDTGTSYDWGGPLVTDSSGNVYTVTQYDQGGKQSFMYSKLYSDGTFATTSRLQSSIGNAYTTAATTDSSGNYYACLMTDYDGFGFKGYLVKYNSSGVLQWQRKYGNIGSFWYSNNAVVCDSVGNIYVGGYSSASGSNQPILLKYNSSGTLQWQNGWTGATGTSINGMAIDSSDNIYAVTGGGTTPSRESHIMKLNTSGSLVWQRKISSDSILNKVAVNTAGDIFVSGLTGTSGTGLVAKYNSSGTIQWQRTLTNCTFNSQLVWKKNALFIGGASSLNGFTIAYLVKFPDTGALTASYNVGSITNVYAASSLTESVGSLSTASVSNTEQVGSMITTTHTFVNTASSLTQAIKII